MAATQAGMKRFYTLFAVMAVVGLGVLGYLLTRPATVSIPANVTVQPSDTSGFAGYVKGSPTAPVEITEYADYQCPFCQTFATLQMPTIQERLIDTGRLRWRYRDFPLQQHSFCPAGRPLCRLRRRAGEVLGAAPAHLRGPAGVGRAVADCSPDLPEICPVCWARSWYDTTHVCRPRKYAGRIQADYNSGRRAGRELDANSAGKRAIVSRTVRLRRDHQTGGLTGTTHHSMIYRMSAALLSLAGLFISAYLYLYKIGKIGSLACGTGGLRDGAAEPLEPRGGDRGGTRSGLVGYVGLLALSLAALQPGLSERRWPSTAAGGARRRRSSVHGLPHLPRAVRHPRHLPLVRGLRRRHPGHLPRVASRPAPAAPDSGTSEVTRDATASPPEVVARRPGARRARGRLRRHRHQPALRAQGVLHRAPRRAGHQGQRARRALAGLLVAQLRRHLQVPQRRHAGGQPGRGRHPRPARAGAAPRRGPAPARLPLADRHRPVRRGAAVRRRHHHPGHLGARRGRRLSVATPALQQWVVPIAVVIISALFAVQRHGTAGIGAHLRAAHR